MITSDERENIIQETLERILKILPETIGNLMKAQSMYQQLTKSFYASNPELKDHTDIVREVVAKVESSNPVASYEDVLRNALPKIKDQIKLKGKLSMDTPSNGAI